MEDEIEQLKLLATRRERAYYFNSIVASLPTDERILAAAMAVDPSKPKDETALEMLRFAHRAAKLDKDKLEHISKLYREICPRVPGRGEVIKVADLIDYKQYQEAMEIVRKRSALEERWQVSMQFQGIRAAFYDQTLSQDGKILCDEFLTYIRKKGLEYALKKDLHRKTLLVHALLFLFELRLAKWSPTDPADDRILSCIEKQFQHQW